MAGKSQGLRVEIYDNVYHLRSDSEDEYTKELAKAVDARMRALAEKTRTYDSLRLAVLAALHFADECERLRQRYASLNTAVTEKSLRFSEALDDVLKKGA